MREAKSRK